MVMNDIIWYFLSGSALGYTYVSSLYYLFEHLNYDESIKQTLFTEITLIELNLGFAHYEITFLILGFLISECVASHLILNPLMQIHFPSRTTTSKTWNRTLALMKVSLIFSD